MLQTLREFSRYGDRGKRGRIEIEVLEESRGAEEDGIKGPTTDHGMIAASGLIIPTLLAGNLNFAREPEAGMYTGSVICCN